ncbi:hypothetical protein AVENP_3003 [Arcobacter venerupis]|uniref:Uncharacterized protein n=1 Tax=Arcobacter venerupis TaxID=1054033 RepID=A0AAE7BAL9_9BACT|nr:hypothetical protein [Arcobacter venerupis]QKF68478.1 hypothetical protein AVENP_3003 [Arcobacter venerupis]RWS48939.1 hypothetical protein CKA56_10985 [Arcobacter venerupis]
MQVYLYAKSGHTIGLDATKRCAAIANALKEFDPILCTSDFRAGAFAKDNLGIKKYVNIDVVRNLHNIMQRRDILIYDTPEVNEEMKKDMKEFCTFLYEVGVEIDGIIVDKSIYSKNQTPNLEKTIFFGDDDYNNLFLKMTKEYEKFDLNLLMGHYFFLGNEKIFSKHFSNVIEEEEYVQTIQNSKYLLTASLQTALESLACGNNPVLFKRIDKSYDDKLINELNLPVLEFTNIKDLINQFDSIIKNYPTITNFKIINLDNYISEIKNKIELFNKLLKT